ncbi:2-methylcitrate dehydratase PrpD [Bradyrhizobium sp. LM6.11]
MTIGPTVSGKISLARQMARRVIALDLGDFGSEVVAKAKICLLDFLSCAFEAGHHPWSRQAVSIANAGGSATIVGRPQPSSPADAAFANAVMGHGLVREDMHAASIAHHGVVIWPTLLALSEQTPLHGGRLLTAAIIGYETGARIGRALVSSDLARLYRPTGLVAPIGAALAGSFRAWPFRGRRDQRHRDRGQYVERAERVAACRQLGHVFSSGLRRQQRN